MRNYIIPVPKWIHFILKYNVQAQEENGALQT
jgi:hypothetical protein